MKSDTKNCDGCKFGAWVGLEFTCKKKHKPKFYKPQNMGDPNWGYKIKCRDYKSTSV